MAGARAALAFALLLALGLLCAACAGRGAGRAKTVAPVRLAAVAEQGDPARRASTRLLLQGLDADAAGRPDAAVAQYDRALQVDPTNPYAYLAVARHELDAARPERALRFLDRTEALLPEASSRGATVHLLGLRGAALYQLGRVDEALPLLERARRLAPRVWSDGRLDARELR